MNLTKITNFIWEDYDTPPPSSFTLAVDGMELAFLYRVRMGNVMGYRWVAKQIFGISTQTSSERS